MMRIIIIIAAISLFTYLFVYYLCVFVRYVCFDSSPTTCFVSTPMQPYPMLVFTKCTCSVLSHRNGVTYCNSPSNNCKHEPPNPSFANMNCYNCIFQINDHYETIFGFTQTEIFSLVKQYGFR
jgi:hypothetical protein